MSIVELLLITAAEFGVLYLLFLFFKGRAERERLSDPRPHPLADILSATNPMERPPKEILPTGFALPLDTDEADLIRRIDDSAPRRPDPLYEYDRMVTEMLQKRAREEKAE